MLVLATILCAAAQVPEEPTLAEVQEAAARRAAGSADEDRSRVARARASHWAPVVRGQMGGREDDRSRRGEYREAPLRWDEAGGSLNWAVTVTWDLAQLVFTRDETQLLHAHVGAARARQRVAAEATQIYLERRSRLRELKRTAPEGRAGVQLEILRFTARLHALTGLYRATLDRLDAEAEAQPTPKEPRR